MLALSLGPLTRSLAGTYDFTFVDAPTAASGPAEPGVPEGLLGYEWWGDPGGAYDTAWRPAYEHGFDVAMARLAALAAGGRGGSGEGGEGGEGGGAFDGVIGFSQGAAMALLVPGARWAVLLSAIPPPRGRGPSTGRRDARPSLHVYDAAEPHAHLCRRGGGAF
mmetsp:Transcript_44730/g.144280  ORF Transcript_44730/g.144280 Transcript_44730/m.144280 type:complete len:164 (+) Transcript_44730:1-492(+)